MTPDKHQDWLKNDPLTRCAELLVRESWASAGELDRIQAEALAEMDAAVEFSRNSPWPDLDELIAGVYAGEA